MMPRRQSFSACPSWLLPCPNRGRRGGTALYNLVRSRPMVLLVFAALVGMACNGPLHAAVELPAAEVDLVAAPTADGEAVSAQVVLAGGCFWCTEAVFEQLEGVTEVVSGYAGGARDDATYDKVSAGLTEHAEVIRVSYDPSVISYGALLRVFFSVAHDPTQVDRQGNDIGRQYRSAVFYAGDDQKRVAQAYIQQLDGAGVFGRPIATKLEPLTVFFPAEEYHQNYVELNPYQGYVRAVALPKVAKVRKHFADLLKSDSVE